MIWTEALLPILVATGLLVIPGLAVSWCLGLRSYAGLALSPVLSASIVGIAGIVGGWSGIPWSVGLYVTVVVVIACLALVVTYLAPAPEPIQVPKQSKNWTSFATFLAVAAGAVLIAWRLMQLFQAPENISQRFDNVFHLNAVRFILDSGNASTLSLGSMSGATGLAALYPSAWHSFTALVSQITGASIPLAVNSFNIAFSAVAWPLGCILLARRVVGPGAVATLAAGVLSAAQLSFPALLLVWGPLYPNALSLALLPAVIATVVTLAGIVKAEERASGVWWTAFLMSLPGLATTHTSSLNALLVFSLPILIFALVAKIRSYGSWQPGRRRSIVMLLALAVSVSALSWVIWLKVRPGFYDFWGPHQSEGGAVGEAITSAPMGTQVAWTVTVLMVIGFVSAWRRPSWRWVPFSYAITVALYVVDASMPRGDVRAFLTGVWYQDTYRLAAFLPLFTTLLAAMGAAATAQRLQVWASKTPRVASMLKLTPTYQVGITASIVFVFGLAAATQYGALRQYIIESKPFYSLDGNSPILSTDEAKLLARLSNDVPPDAVIADNPWNGSSLAYALSGRKVLVHHLFADLTPEQETINRDLGTNAPDSQVCPAVQVTKVKFVLDFGARYLAPNDASNNFPGVTEVGPSQRLALVDQEGAAKLYRVVGCS